MLKRSCVIIVALLVLSACAQMKSGSTLQSSTQATTQSRQSAQQSTLVRQHIETGEYQKAIDEYRSEYAKRPQDQVLVKEYVKGLEDIKAAADGALKKEDYVSAGKAYKVLQKNYPEFKGFSTMLSFDRAYLNAKLTTCRDALSKKGFQEYRQGNLNEAISLWQGYLVIDPTNGDIKKALNTAKIQQKNLQQTK
jgi:tetratricopeptide (TPR) repeat protein